jgi:hypothetical protein
LLPPVARRLRCRPLVGAALALAALDVLPAPLTYAASPAVAPVVAKAGPPAASAPATPSASPTTPAASTSLLSSAWLSSSVLTDTGLSAAAVPTTTGAGDSVSSPGARRPAHAEAGRRPPARKVTDTVTTPVGPAIAPWLLAAVATGLAAAAMSVLVTRRRHIAQRRRAAARLRNQVAALRVGAAR